MLVASNTKAFKAYRVLYYPVFGIGGKVDDGVFSEVSMPDEEDLLKVLTVQLNMEVLGYELSQDSLFALVFYYSILRLLPRRDAQELLVDPAADLRLHLIGTGDMPSPPYPGFPDECVQMPIRNMKLVRAYNALLSLIGDATHESIQGAFENPTALRRRGPVIRESGRKTKGSGRQEVKLCFSAEALAAGLGAELRKPAPMPGEAFELAADISDTLDISEFIGHVPYHDNRMELLYAASLKSASAIEKMAGAIDGLTPTDLLEAVNWCAEKDRGVREARRLRLIEESYGASMEDIEKAVGHAKLTTKQKRGFCRALGAFSVSELATCIADNARDMIRATNRLSINRFGSANLVSAVSLVEHKAERSWHSKLDAKWDRFLTDQSDGSLRNLMDQYAERPQVMLRSLTQIYSRAGTRSAKFISERLMRRIDSYTMDSLVRLLTAMSSIDIAMNLASPRQQHNMEALARKRHDGSFEAWRQKRRHELAVRSAVAELLVPVVEAKMREADTPLRGRRVYVETSGFSLTGSVIYPETERPETRPYPPAGMAYELPSSGVVRFFTCWDNPTRIGIDMVFRGQRMDGDQMELVKRDRNTMSYSLDYNGIEMKDDGGLPATVGDEYIDVDMERAKEGKYDLLIHNQKLVSGADDWNEIASCCAGAVVIDDYAEPEGIDEYREFALYCTDLGNDDGTSLDYALISVQEGWARMLHGGSRIPFRKTLFNLGVYLSLLLTAQNCRIVDDPDDADVILSVGKSDDPKAVCLIEENFFM